MNNLKIDKDLENYQELKLKCPEALQEYLPEFFKEWLKELESICVAGRSYDELKTLCHRWKGFLSSYGLEGLGRLIVNFEQELIEGFVCEDQVCKNIDCVKNYLIQLIKESR